MDPLDQLRPRPPAALLHSIDRARDALQAAERAEHNGQAEQLTACLADLMVRAHIGLHAVLGDDPERIASALARAVARADGLRTNADDSTPAARHLRPVPEFRRARYDAAAVADLDGQPAPVQPPAYHQPHILCYCATYGPVGHRPHDYDHDEHDGDHDQPDPGVTTPGEHAARQELQPPGPRPSAALPAGCNCGAGSVTASAHAWWCIRWN